MCLVFNNRIFLIFRERELMTTDDSFVNGRTQVKKERGKFVIIKIFYCESHPWQFIYTSKNIFKRVLNCLKIYEREILLLCLNCVSFHNESFNSSSLWHKISHIFNFMSSQNSPFLTIFSYSFEEKKLYFLRSDDE